MRVAPDAGQDDQSGPANRVQSSTPSPGSDGPVRDGAIRVPERRAAARRTRRRQRLSQAVGTRRRPISARTETLGRLGLGLALLAVVGLIAWVEVTLLREPADSAARNVAVARGTGGASSAADAPTPIPDPTATPEIPRGPEISAILREANGPTAGCTFHPR